MLDLLDKHHEANSFTRAATLAWTQAQVQLRHLGIDSAEAGLFQRLAGHLLYADASLRPPSNVIREGGGPPSGLWSQRISGDLPILLLRIDDIEDIAIAHQLLQAHEYWQMKGLAVDLVLLNDRAASYVQDLQNALETLARMSQSRPLPAAPVEYAPFVVLGWLVAGVILVWAVSRTGREEWLIKASEVAYERTPTPEEEADEGAL